MLGEFAGVDGDAVRRAVAVGVGEDLDAIASGTGIAAGVLEALGDPEPAPFVDAHGDGVHDVRLGGDDLDGEAVGDAHLRDGLGGGEGRARGLVLGVGDLAPLGEGG
jgi:hypothetical protein